MEAKKTNVSSDTERRLLAAATKEFSAHGYDGASLRQICSSAGVTTGALYFFFQNKEDLFRRVIGPVADPFSHNLDAEAQASHETILALAHDVLSENGSANALYELLALCYEHRTEALIMVDNRSTPVVKEIVDRAKDCIVTHVRACLLDEGSDLSVWDPLVKGWLADLTVNAFVDIIRGDEDLEAAERHMTVILGFVRSGASALLASEKKSAA